jgi:plasmid stabilization system protein ParE
MEEPYCFRKTLVPLPVSPPSEEEIITTDDITWETHVAKICEEFGEDPAEKYFREIKAKVAMLAKLIAENFADSNNPIEKVFVDLQAAVINLENTWRSYVSNRFAQRINAH